MPLTDELLAHCPYAPDAVFIDEIVEMDKQAGRIVLRVPTRADMPLVCHQRVHPTRHPAHMAGGLLIHITGMAGYVFGHEILGLRGADGWVVFGGALHDVRFHSLAFIGPPLFFEGQSIEVRRHEHKVGVRFQSRFTQNEKLVYEGEQTAVFVNTPD